MPSLQHTVTPSGDLHLGRGAESLADWEDDLPLSISHGVQPSAFSGNALQWKSPYGSTALAT